MSTPPDIKGLDLKIDGSIQKICEVSNDTSSSTRSILYILVLVNILSLIAIINTRPRNWSVTRLNDVGDSIRMPRADSIRTNSFKLKEASLIRNKVENSQTVRIPILGNTFDVNDLNSVAGVTFLILLFILRFTIMREINNLKIALQSISERYPDTANKDDFQVYLKGRSKQGQGIKKKDILTQINFTRRKHHYNFLSMNEIFTLPPLEIDEGKKINRVFVWAANHIYWLPSVIYFFILLNDISTVKIGLDISRLNTFIGLFVGLFCTILIAFLCHRCATQKIILNNLYQHFSMNRYKYEKEGFSYSVNVAWIVILTELIILLIVAFGTGGFQKLLGM
jgi:hypothetical protein